MFKDFAITNCKHAIYNWFFGFPHIGVRIRSSLIISNMKIYGSEKILEAGCANGLLSANIAKMFPKAQIIGVDISQGNIEQAKGIKDIHHISNIEFLEEDLCHLGFESSVFDKVLCVDVIEHIDNDHVAISEISRVLCVGGELLLTTPTSLIEKRRYFYRAIAQADHIRDGYDPMELKRLIEDSNLEVVYQRHYCGVLDEFAWECDRWLFDNNPIIQRVFFPFLLVLARIGMFFSKSGPGNGIFIKAVKKPYHKIS